MTVSRNQIVAGCAALVLIFTGCINTPGGQSGTEQMGECPPFRVVMDDFIPPTAIASPASFRALVAGRYSGMVTTRSGDMPMIVEVVSEGPVSFRDAQPGPCGSSYRVDVRVEVTAEPDFHAVASIMAHGSAYEPLETFVAGGRVVPTAAEGAWAAPSALQDPLIVISAQHTEGVLQGDIGWSEVQADSILYPFRFSVVEATTGP